MRKVIGGNYQSGHHFLCESTWDAEKVNLRRLKLWQADPVMHMNENGWFIQDDTGQERRIRGKERPEGSRRLVGGTDGTARQYIGNVGKVSEGIVWVNTHYTDAEKRTLIKVDMYWPKAALKRLPNCERTPKRERDKIDIAIEQLRWVDKDENIAWPKPKRAVADAWYGSSPRYLNAVHNELKWKYVAAIRSNRRVFPGCLRKGAAQSALRERC